MRPRLLKYHGSEHSYSHRNLAEGCVHLTSVEETQIVDVNGFQKLQEPSDASFGIPLFDAKKGKLPVSVIFKKNLRFFPHLRNERSHPVWLHRHVLHYWIREREREYY